MHDRLLKRMENIMKLTEDILCNYTKKIYGFAYEKTGNHYEAEDLSSEIMLQLLECATKNKDINHISSFIYTVCCYTWSKYLRKNKKYWDNVDIEEIQQIVANTDTEDEVMDKFIYAELHKQISYLSKIHREIVIMHYYENKTTAEIGMILGISEGTVRWYLSNIRDTLKERIDMSENLDFRPIALRVGMDGCAAEPGLLKILESDLLMQNIALACYGEPITITEISEKLNVAAAYLEKHIENMVYMDYLRQHGKKYQTNFFISNFEVELAKVRYAYSYAAPLAEKLYDAVMARKKDFFEIDFYGNGTINEEFFLWYVLLKVAQEKSYEQMQNKWNDCKLERPFRKDGSEYWIIADKKDEGNVDDENLRKFADYRTCIGYKLNTKEGVGAMYQADTYFLHGVDGEKFRDNSTPNIIKLLQAAKAIMKSDDGCEMNEFEKLYVSEFIKQGYISSDKGKLVFNIPVFTGEQWKTLNDIVAEIKASLGKDFFKEYLDGYSDMMEKFIPKFLDDNVRNYYKYAMLGGFDLFAQLIKKSIEGDEKYKLQIPNIEESKHTMTWLVIEGEK